MQKLINCFARLFPNSWGVFFSHPADYTPVCTTELGAVAKIVPDFQKRNTKVIGLSCDPVESHKGWIKDIQAYNMLTGDFPYPLIADPKRELAVQLGMVDPEEKDKAGLPLTCRAVSKVLIYLGSLPLCVCNIVTYANHEEYCGCSVPTRYYGIQLLMHTLLWCMGMQGLVKKMLSCKVKMWP